MMAAAGDGLSSDARAELRRFLSYSPRQFGASALLIALLAVTALQLRAYTWLALFCALLLPLGASVAALRTLQVRHALSWSWLWSGLLLVLSLSCAFAARLYGIGLARFGIDAQNELHVLAAALALGLLMLALPLWVAQNNARALHLSQLRQAALSADLKALQAQIEPHFLYNTLANVRYLARNDPARAVAMLDHMISYLHSALPDLRAPMSNLQREFDLARHYLALMAIRFGDRLRVELECPPLLGQLDLPPLLLMPLVENAVLHGVEPHSGDVTVTLAARREQQGLVMTVRDNGAGLGQQTLGSGVGLRNLRQRLAALYGDAAGFQLRVAADGWIEAELTLPLPAHMEITT